MNTGKIARVTDKGFGFITYEGSDKDLFFHANDVMFDELKEGDDVTFEIAEGPKGLNAVQVAKA